MKYALVLCAVFALAVMQVSCEKSPSDTGTGHRSGGFAVVIDPGHGGPDPGAVFTSETREKDVALSLANRLAVGLREHGMVVTLTRTGDRFVSFAQRREIVRNAHADLVISLHAGLHSKEADPGAVTTFYQAGNTGSVRLNTALHRTWHTQPALQTGKSRPAHFLMLESPVPSVIIDVRSLAGSAGGQKLTEPEFLQSLSASLVQAAETYRGATRSR